MCGETWKTKNMCGEVYREGCGNKSEGLGERDCLPKDKGVLEEHTFNLENQEACMGGREVI